MENSLALKSRQLIEQLSMKKNVNFHNSNMENLPIVENLLFNSNNLRQNKTEVMAVQHHIADSYPKSSITSIVGRSGYLSKSMPRRIPFGMSNQINNTNRNISDLGANKNSDLLGYDWIVGMMENKPHEFQLDKPDEYFEELDRFRRKYKHFCMSADSRDMLQSSIILNSKDYNSGDFKYRAPYPTQELSDALEDSTHVFAYTLNERLFPVPLDLETAERGFPDPEKPHIIKVSIPSNRFLHRNHKSQNLKNKTLLLHQIPEKSNIGESLSLSSHCQPMSKISMPVSQNDKILRTFNSKKQEAAGLIGNLIPQIPDLTGKMYENAIPFSANQPKTEHEAIEQLKHGKTGAKLNRMVPSILDHRGFNIESIQSPTSICQTRIVLKDMGGNTDPKYPNDFKPMISQSEIPVQNLKNALSTVPRSSVSRKEMSIVYKNEIKNVQENVISD